MEISHPCSRCCEKDHTQAYGTTGTGYRRRIPCAAGQLCLIPDHTPQPPDGHKCRGKCGGRLHGFCGDADPDCDDAMPRVCHDCLAAKRSSKDVSGKHKAGKRKVEETGAGGAGSRKSASDDTTTTYGVGAPPPYAEHSPHFNLLACGHGDAAFYLQKARMPFIKAHGSATARHEGVLLGGSSVPVSSTIM